MISWDMEEKGVLHVVERRKEQMFDKLSIYFIINIVPYWCCQTEFDWLSLVIWSPTWQSAELEPTGMMKRMESNTIFNMYTIKKSY